MDLVARTPRFRFVIDVSIEDADPWSPNEYDQVVARFTKGIETMSVCTCRDVVLREYLTIGDGEDYSEWRYHRGYYDYSQREPSISFKPLVGPIPPVDPTDLQALWIVMTRPDPGEVPPPEPLAPVQTVSTSELKDACSPGADLNAVIARVLSLASIESTGALREWQTGNALEERVFRIAATFPLEQMGEFDRDALLKALGSD